jgi:hypothetical protein
MFAYLLSEVEIRHGWILSAQTNPNEVLICICCASQNSIYIVRLFILYLVIFEVNVSDGNEPAEVLPVLVGGER